LQAGIFEVVLEAATSAQPAVAVAAEPAKAAAAAAAVEVKAVAVVAHEVSAVEADLHHIAEPAGSEVHGREK